MCKAPFGAMSRLVAWLSHLTALALLLVMSFRLGSNLLFWRWVRRQARGAHAQPRVSVLIPARNEAATITSCVSSLLDQDYPDYEVIVLNDASSDNTAIQLDMLASQDARLQVIHSHDALPPGWNGKSYACHRLAQRASGEWLLFTDADTVHTPQSIRQGMAQAVVLEADLVSAFPHQETHTWSEKVLVSFILDFLPLVGLDLRAISRGKGSDSAGNGQYLLARASIYRRVGGHAAVHSETLDDFALARHYRLAGHKIALVDGKDWLRCRMYRSAGEAWQGFSRSMMHGLDNSTTRRHSWVGRLLFVWSYASLFVNPFSFVLAGKRYLPAVLAIAWLGLLRWVATAYLRRPLLEVVTTPLAAWGVMLLGITALIRRRLGQTVKWKGRDVAR